MKTKKKNHRLMGGTRVAWRKIVQLKLQNLRQARTKAPEQVQQES